MKKLSKKARTAIISTVAVVLVAAIAGTSGYLIHKKVPVKPSNEVEQVKIDTKTAGTLRMGSSATPSCHRIKSWKRRRRAFTAKT